MPKMILKMVIALICQRIHFQNGYIHVSHYTNQWPYHKIMLTAILFFMNIYINNGMK